MCTSLLGPNVVIGYEVPTKAVATEFTLCLAWLILDPEDRDDMLLRNVN
jgi:hypothetical protein